MLTRILVVEDDPDIAALVARYLEKAGFTVDIASTGRDALTAMAARPPSLLVLDLMLPQVDGLEICRAVRANERTADVPIIILTARAEESDRIVGLEIGADDYMAKPFSPNELVARVRALLRRAQRVGPSLESTVTYGSIVVDRAQHTVMSNGVAVTLTAKEFLLLDVPPAAPGTRVVARRAAQRRLGLPLHWRHAHDRRPRAAFAREAPAARRDTHHRETVRVQARRRVARRGSLMRVISRASFRTKLFLSALSVALMALIVAGALLATSMQRQANLRIEETLVAEARMAAELLARSGPIATLANLNEEAHRIGSLLNARVTFIAPDGRVVGDSAETLEGLSALDNHEMRPEVVDARDIGMGRARRHSNTLGMDMLYVAVRARHPAIAFVRVALPLTDVRHQLRAVLIATLTALGLALVGAAALAWLISGRIGERSAVSPRSRSATGVET